MAEVLSQEEIDALLSALTTGEVSASSMVSDSAERAARVRPYDFLRPSKFSKEQIRTLHFMHETYGRLWSTTLSGVLRNLVSISVNSVDQVTYQEFMLSIPNPTITATFSLPPLEGKALMEFSPTIGFPILDRLLGGSGGSSMVTRELTEIESHVIANLIDDSMVFLKEAWASMIDLDPELHDLESNPLFLQIVPPSDMTLLITLEARIGDFSGIINILYPYVLLEPILSLLSAQTLYAIGTRSSSEESRERTRRLLNNVELPLSVELGTANVSMRDILSLEAGDLVVLQKKTHEELSVKVRGIEKFLARPGNAGKHRAAQISQVVAEQEAPLPFLKSRR